ncbi:radical SAM protein [Lactococcus insecticola]|uniref:Radical SAM core domain-containing protein n=1 Tax=Pseudolactococcus insecticola TaxID=2709158 RepID=A0A6A0B5J2_9LACT|nr:radical SAM protein [Lactococcus insecticola]GFH39778.1 hypothetical protein Hs20B_01760 [Lactococcus insecticola]
MFNDILNYNDKLSSATYRKWLSDFADSKRVYPQIIELDPTTNCMLACPECISAELLNGKSIPKEIMYSMIDNFSEHNVKGLIFIGGGEPLMYPRFGSLLNYAASKGLKNGITTNGVLIDKYLESIAKNAAWVRVSVDSSNASSFQIARPNRVPNVFDRIINGMRELAKIKTGLLGYSFLLLETRGFSNAKELYDAASLAKEIGCDYFEYKPMVDGMHFLTKYSDEFLNTVWEMQDKMKTLETDDFKIMMPQSMEMYRKDNLNQPKNYHECPLIKLRSLVTPTGVYPCPYKRGQLKYSLGNIDENNDFYSLFDKSGVYEHLDPSRDCQFYCIRNDINEFLFNLLSGDIKVDELPVSSIKDVFV